MGLKGTFLSKILRGLFLRQRLLGKPSINLNHSSLITYHFLTTIFALSIQLIYLSNIKV